MDFITVVNFLISTGLFLKFYLCVIIGNNGSVLIAAVPQVRNSEGTASWERGEEILPGALQAAGDINNE